MTSTCLICVFAAALIALSGELCPSPVAAAAAAAAEELRHETKTGIRGIQKPSSSFHSASTSDFDRGHGLLTTTVPKHFKRLQRYGPLTPDIATGLSPMRYRCRLHYGCKTHPRQKTSDALLRMLGNDFNRKWMSIEAPPLEGLNGTVEQSVDMELHRKLSELDFTYRDENGTKHPIKESMRRYIEKWLVQKSSCPIRMTWNDLGESFWPRWVRQGFCNSSISCSWPPGMHCVPEESETLRILRWQCRAKGGGSPPRPERQNSKDGGEKDMHCRWKKVPIPVTARCFCSC